MAGNNVTEVVVGATGKIYVGPTSATAPTNINSPLVTPWVELGFVSEDGAKLTDAKTIENIGAWQSFYPVRILETARMAKAAFALEQWNTATLSLAAGGGTVSTAGTGKKFTPHAAGTISEWSIVIDLTDGAITDRFVIPKCMVTSALESQHNRTDLALMPVEVEAIGVNGVDAWLFYSNATTAFT